MSNTLQELAGQYTTEVFGEYDPYQQAEYDMFKQHLLNFAKLAGLSESVNGKLIEAAENLLHLHLCEQEGLLSGKPTREQWLTAVDKLSEALQSIGEVSDAVEFAEWVAKNNYIVSSQPASSTELLKEIEHLKELLELSKDAFYEILQDETDPKIAAGGALLILTYNKTKPVSEETKAWAAEVIEKHKTNNL
jgi:hypothetical protein